MEVSPEGGPIVVLFLILLLAVACVSQSTLGPVTPVETSAPAVVATPAVSPSA